MRENRIGFDFDLKKRDLQFMNAVFLDRCVHLEEKSTPSLSVQVIVLHPLASPVNAVLNVSCYHFTFPVM